MDRKELEVLVQVFPVPGGVHFYKYDYNSTKIDYVGAFAFYKKINVAVGILYVLTTFDGRFVFYLASEERIVKRLEAPHFAVAYKAQSIALGWFLYAKSLKNPRWFRYNFTTGISEPYEN